MKKSKTMTIKINLWIAIVSISILLTLGLYLFVFGSFTFSRDINEWASFGSYAGGILGPTFSLFAFIYIVRTFELQQEQITEIRKQSEISAIQTMINKSLSTADDIFMSNITQAVEGGPTKLGPSLEMIDALYHSVNSSNAPDSLKEMNKNLLAKFKETIEIEDAYILIIELTNLCSLYDDFRHAGGSERLLERYVSRHYEFTNGLHRLDFLQPRANDIISYYPPTVFKE